MLLVRTGSCGSSSRGLSAFFFKFIQRLQQNTGVALNWELIQVLSETQERRNMNLKYVWMHFGGPADDFSVVQNQDQNTTRRQGLFLSPF